MKYFDSSCKTVMLKEMKIDLVIVKKMADLTYSVVSSLILAIMDSYICYS